MRMFGLSADELAVLKKLSKPLKIQHFLDSLDYNKEHEGETCRSPRRVLRDRTAHCLEGALLAAAARRVKGHPPLLVDLEAVRDDDHVIAVFKEKGLWGAIAQSNFSGLGYRPPVFLTIRELVMSYFEQYFNDDKEYTLRRYSQPLHLERFDGINWMTTEKELFSIGSYFGKVPHYNIIPKGLRLGRVRERVYKAGCVGRIMK